MNSTDMYQLEIYRPGSTYDVLITFKSAQPFMAIHQGSLLNPRTCALEAAFGRELQARGYDLIGSHASRKPLDQEVFARVLAAIEDEFPPLV